MSSQFRNVSTLNIFSLRTPTGGKSQFTGLRAILACNAVRHSEKLGADNIKTPASREKIRPPEFFVLQNLEIFSPPDPHGWEIAIDHFLDQFGPSGTKIILGRKQKNTISRSYRHSFGGKSGRSDGFVKIPQLSYLQHFFRLDPHGREVAIYWGFGPFLPDFYHLVHACTYPHHAFLQGAQEAALGAKVLCVAGGTAVIAAFAIVSMKKRANNAERKSMSLHASPAQVVCFEFPACLASPEPVRSVRCTTIQMAFTH